MPGGRPTKYDPKYCQMVIDHMATGLSFEAFAAVIGVAKETLYTWVDKHPEFMDAKKEAFEKSRLFWEKVGVGQATGEIKGSSTTWIFNMKNRFGYRDKIEVSGDEDKPFAIAYRPKSKRKKDE